MASQYTRQLMEQQLADPALDQFVPRGNTLERSLRAWLRTLSKYLPRICRPTALYNGAPLRAADCGLGWSPY
jgi:hypothetical protein